MSDRSARLSGSWAHSFEEDEPGVQVYRPSGTFPFPPSRRGRETLEFGPGEQDVAVGGPGPDDRPRSTRMRLTNQGGGRYGLGGMPGEAGRLLEVVEAGPEVLKVRVSDPGG